MNDPHRDFFVGGIEAVEFRFRPDDGERALVDRRAVLLVNVVHHSVLASAGAPAIVSIALLRRVVQ